VLDAISVDCATSHDVAGAARIMNDILGDDSRQPGGSEPVA
jgi:hypothetical protein